MEASADRFDSPFGPLHLARFPLPNTPPGKQQPLQAWDAADALLLQQVSDHGDPGRTLVLNDSFGALACALHCYQPVSQSDSFLAQEATRRNLHSPGLDPSAVTLITSLEHPAGLFDTVLVKVPRQLALLQHQLLNLRPSVTATTRVVLAGMVKYLTPRVWELAEQCLGSTTTSRAQKKARLIHITPHAEYATVSSNHPSSEPSDYPVEGFAQPVSAHAGVFAQGKLDIGTRFLLQHLNQQQPRAAIADLGCGSGLLGIAAAQQHPQATVHFCDESFMAIASARTNATRMLPAEQPLHFHAGHCLQGVADHSLDWVLNNPPFHQQHAIGDQIAWDMFMDARRALDHGGELWVVANRHLNTHIKLKKLFGHCDTLSANRKFVILRARKPTAPRSQ